MRAGLQWTSLNMVGHAEILAGNAKSPYQPKVWGFFVGIARKTVDWEAVEREYRAGIRSLRDIAAEFDITDTAIRKRAKRDDWVRDLSAKVSAKADAMVRRLEVRREVRSEVAITERELVETNAAMLADKVINQREDIKRARSIVNKLFAEVEAECDNREDFLILGELLAAPDESGKDRLNEMYRAAISLPERVKSAKALSEALKVLIDLERRVLKLDDFTPGGGEDKVVRVELVALQ